MGVHYARMRPTEQGGAAFYPLTLCELCAHEHNFLCAMLTRLLRILSRLADKLLIFYTVTYTGSG